MSTFESHDLPEELVRRRREAMRPELLRAVDRRRRRVRIRQVCQAGLVLVGLAVGAWWLVPDVDRAPASDGQLGDALVAGAVELVTDTPGIESRTRVSGRPLASGTHVSDRPVTRMAGVMVRNRPIGEALRLDDDNLGDWLRQAGIAPARARVGDRVRVFALEPQAEE